MNHEYVSVVDEMCDRNDKLAHEWLSKIALAAIEIGGLSQIPSDTVSDIEA